MAGKVIKVTRTNEPITAERLGDTSSDDSDDTVIQTELLKQFGISDDSESEEEVSRTSSSEYSHTPTDQVKSNQSNSNDENEVVEEAPATKKDSPSVYEVANAHESNQIQLNKQNEVVEKDPEPSLSVTTLPSSIPKGVSVKINKFLNHKLRSKIKHTTRVQKSISKEISRRKKILEVSLATAKILDHPEVVPNQLVNYDASRKGAYSRIKHQTGRIPKIGTLDQEIVKASVERLAKSRRLSTSYTLISEILLVKQILARGNPFRVIPQHAMDISRVPGIRRPHIQRLLQQWEIYFSNLLYQIVQVEYSVDFADVEKRISIMVGNVDKFDTLCQFQSFIGKEEISIESFSNSGSDQKTDVDPPVNKKTKIDEECGPGDKPGVSGIKTVKVNGSNKKTNNVKEDRNGPKVPK